MEHQFQYTVNMQSIFQNSLSELKSWYCREDFERALEAVDCAKDARRFRMKDLKRLCDARDIPVEALLADRSILDTIPSREQLQNRLLESFYLMYRHAPGTEAVMERIVRRLAPEYGTDTVRTAILKKFVVGSDNSFRRFNTASILEWAQGRLDKREREEFAALAEEDRKAYLLSKVDDSVFTRESSGMTDQDVFLLIADRIAKYREDDALAFDELKLTPRTSDGLRKIFQDFVPEGESLTDTEIVLSAAASDQRGLISGRIFTEHAAFIRTLEKEFRAQLKTIARISRTGKAGTADDQYRQAKKDVKKAKKAAVKKSGPDVDLLDLCTDLAAGNFRVNGKTKVHLYYFAFMFGMSIPMEGKPCSPDRDMAAVLFQDFYSDNLLRFLSGDYADSAQESSLEKEPTGEGINYKNFAEVIYLYFLCHDETAPTPGGRIDQAEDVIEACVKLAKDGKGIQTSAGDRDTARTQVYRDTHLNVLFQLRPEELAGYIIKHYDIISPDNPGTTRIMVSSGDRTASGLIDEIMELIDADLPVVEFDDMFRTAVMEKEEADEQKFRDDIQYESGTEFDWKIRDLLEERYAGNAGFMKVLDKLDDRVSMRNGRFGRKERARMLRMLHVLALYSGNGRALTTEQIKDRMEERGDISAGFHRSCSRKTLEDAGFAIRCIESRKKSDNSRTRKRYYLEQSVYEDNVMNDLIRTVSARYYVPDEASDLMLADILIRRMRHDRRITRSELIAVHLNYYIMLLNETEGLDTFPEVFEDYASTINPLLEEARYQPLCVKNIFDMYVVTALYIYLTENTGYLNG